MKHDIKSILSFANKNLSNLDTDQEGQVFYQRIGTRWQTRIVQARKISIRSIQISENFETMSYLLAKWLNEELKISQKVAPTELDSSLKSGWILGEVLDKLDLQDDFPKKFSSGQTLESYIKNYTLVERTLSDKLGLKLSSNEAFDLINGKSGSAAKLLYQIKSAVERLPEPDTIGRPIKIKKPATKPSLSLKKDPRSSASYPSSPIGK